MSRTIARGFEKFVVDSYDGWEDVDAVALYFYDCEMNETFCNLVDFPYARNEQFNVYFNFETLQVQVLKNDSNEYFTVDIIAAHFKKCSDKIL